MKTLQSNLPLYFILTLSCQLFCVSFAKAASLALSVIDGDRPLLQTPGQVVDPARQLAKPVAGALQESGL